jgi:hypothetical protein
VYRSQVDSRAGQARRLVAQSVVEPVFVVAAAVEICTIPDAFSVSFPSVNLLSSRACLGKTIRFPTENGTSRKTVLAPVPPKSAAATASFPVLTKP